MMEGSGGWLVMQWMLAFLTTNVQDCLSAPLVHLVLAKDKVTHCCYCCLWWWLCVCGLMHNIPLIQFLISVLYILFACLYCMLPHLSFFSHFFLTLSFLIFFFENKPTPFPSPKWPILCRLGHKTTTQSISQLYVCVSSVIRCHKLTDFKSEQIAEQMTLLDARLFQKIEVLIHFCLLLKLESYMPFALLFFFASFVYNCLFVWVICTEIYVSG